MAGDWVPRVVLSVALIAVGASPAHAQQPAQQPAQRPAAAAALQAPSHATSDEIVEVPAPPLTNLYPSTGFTPWPFGVVLTGVGVTGIVTGLLIGLTALLQSDDARSPSSGVGCVDTHCTPIAYATLKQAHTISIVADVALWSGVGLAVVGAILMFALGDYGGPAVSAACDGNGCQAAVRGVF